MTWAREMVSAMPASSMITNVCGPVRLSGVGLSCSMSHSNFATVVAWPIWSPRRLAATADVPALENFARSLSLVFARAPAVDGAPADSYSIDHSATIAVLDPQGRMAGIIQPPLQPKAIAADLTALTALMAASAK